MVFLLLISNAAASVSVPMEAKQYMRHLVEQCMMQFFIAVKARESGQLFLKVCIYLEIQYHLYYSCVVPSTNAVSIASKHMCTCV